MSNEEKQEVVATVSPNPNPPFGMAKAIAVLGVAMMLLCRPEGGGADDIQGCEKVREKYTEIFRSGYCRSHNRIGACGDGVLTLGEDF